MTPEQFWGRPDDIGTGITLRELSVILKGHEAQTRRQMEMLAWTCANIMNCWTKKTIKPKDLLPRQKGQASEPSDYEKKRSMPDTVEGFKAMMRKKKEEAETNQPGNAVDSFDIVGATEGEYFSYDEDIDLSSFGEGE